MEEKRFRIGVAGQNPRRLAAAIKPYIERRQGPHRASINPLGPRTAEVVFAVVQKLSSNPATAKRRQNAQDAYHPDPSGHARLICRWAKPSMAKSNGLTVFLGDDQARGIKVGFGKDHHLQ